MVCYIWCLLQAAGLSTDDVDRWLLSFVLLLLGDFVIFEPIKVMLAAVYWLLAKDTLPYY